ncbi:MAG: hypothetical protein IJK89_09150 [Clostridia bacterium]|nr:hypothetical protein [Clostridia bacterium]
MKKILAVLLAVVLAVGMLPAIVFAATPIDINAAYFELDTEGHRILVGTMGGGRDYRLVAGENAVIEEDQTWTVEEGTTLYVYGKLEVKGKLIVKGVITGVGNEENAGIVIARCWKDGSEIKRGVVINSQNICGNETNESKRYFAEVYFPKTTRYDGFAESEHQLRVMYLASRTGGEYDYLSSDLYYENSGLEQPSWYFQNVYTSDAYDDEAGVLTVPMNQHLFLHFDFLTNGAVSKKYDGNRMAVKFNGVPVLSVQGVCIQKITSPGEIEYWPAELVNKSGAVYNVWMDSYFLRQERIYIPSGEGYSAYGVNGEISAVDQTVRLNYGDEFKFRVKIDSKYSDSVYQVYLVQGYQWDSRNHADTMDALVEDVRVDDNGNFVHYAWKFEAEKPGENQKVYVDEYGIYHIASVDDEYTIVVTGVVSNDTLSTVGNIVDTIRNLLNAIKQFFDRVKQMLGL